MEERVNYDVKECPSGSKVGQKKRPRGLYAESKDPDWERIVYMQVVGKEEMVESLAVPGYYKVMLIEKGKVSIENQDRKKVQTVTAPAVILLNDDKIEKISLKEAEVQTLFFQPTEIREEFTIENIRSGELEKEEGRTIFQDYILLKNFEKKEERNKVMSLGLGVFTKLGKLLENIQKELTEQMDGFWPCRSRSYLMELLYFLRYACMNENEESKVEDTPQDNIDRIIAYLGEHMGEKITQEDITRKFSMNRNLLNAMFMKETSMTCMNYLEKMRINLSKIMLAETELKIGEIAGRVGYPDANYFIKVFKKNTGVTPSTYRKDCANIATLNADVSHS